MQIDDFTSNGMVRRWSLIDGQPRCVDDAIDANAAGALAALQQNAAIRVLIGPVEAYEAAQAIVARGEPDNGQPKEIADPAWVDPQDGSTAPLIANPDWALLPRTVSTVGADGQPVTTPEPRWTVYDDAQATVAAASETTLALARWREAEPHAEAPEHAAWTLAKTDALTALETAIAAKIAAALPQARADKKAALANRRWQAETGGATVAGMSVPTDDRSQAKFAGAALAAVLDPNYSARWKLADGFFVELSHDQVIGLAQGVRAHIQACFDREADMISAIDAAATPAALDAIDIEAGWPA